MSELKETPRVSKRIVFKNVDRFLKNLHTNRNGFNKLIIIGISLVIYTAVLLLSGKFLGVSANYFIVIPMVSVTFSFGFWGGLISGAFALPLNLLMFYLIGHPEFSPASKLIAEITGLAIGTVLGYISDYYYEIETEIERRRKAEMKLQQSLSEKEILIGEIHHRVKNNLNIVKSLIQLQLNRSESPQFIAEGEKLINRIYSIARVHDQLYKDSNSAFSMLDKYIPQLVEDILTGLGQGELEVKYFIESKDVEMNIEQASSLGLIINEVLTNAIKYSLVLVESPRLEVYLRVESGKIIIDLKNNAPTFIPEGDDYTGLGLKLIKTLCSQLHADYEYLPGGGTTFRLSLPPAKVPNLL